MRNPHRTNETHRTSPHRIESSRPPRAAPPETRHPPPQCSPLADPVHSKCPAQIHILHRAVGTPPARTNAAAPPSATVHTSVDPCQQYRPGRTGSSLGLRTARNHPQEFQCRRERRGSSPPCSFPNPGCIPPPATSRRRSESPHTILP